MSWSRTQPSPTNQSINHPTARTYQPVSLLLFPFLPPNSSCLLLRRRHGAVNCIAGQVTEGAAAAASSATATKPGAAMASDVPMSPELEQVDGEIQDIFRALQNGFQKIDKIKDSNRQSKQLEDLTAKMRECKRLIKEFDRVLKEDEKKNPPDVNKQLNDKKQFMIKELNSYVTLRKTYQSSLGIKRIELFDTGNDQVAEDTAQIASEMSNQELIHAGRKQMDQTDQAIERSKMVVAQTVEVGAQTAATLTQQTEQMKRIGNELDSVHFSLKKASQMVKEIGRQVATDKCIMAFLFLIVAGVIAIIVVKIVNPNNKNIRNIPALPGLAPPAMNRRLLSIEAFGGL